MYNIIMYCTMIYTSFQGEGRIPTIPYKGIGVQHYNGTLILINIGILGTPRHPPSIALKLEQGVCESEWLCCESTTIMIASATRFTRPVYNKEDSSV